MHGKKNLHERPAEERDQDHWQPRWHLGEAPGDIGVRNSQVELLKLAVERVEEALVGRNLLDLVVDNQRLQSLSRGAGAVQGLISDDWDRRRLVSQRLGDGKVVERRRANRPRVAENVLGFAVKVSELGRVRLGRKHWK